MSSADTPPCIHSNPDISGIGVRTAIYAQNILSFAPAFFALRDRTITVTELETLETQSTTILITAFAILISTIVQALTDGITNFHITIILNLSWMNNTNLFIYFLLYVYRKAEEAQKEPTRARTLTHYRVKRIKAALKNPVFPIGSLHLSLMAAVGMWFWSRPASFGGSRPCAMSTYVTILGYGVKLDSPGLRGWSILVYSLLLIPALNLVVPIAFLAVPYLIFRRILSSSSQVKINMWSVVTGLIVLAMVNVVFIADTEITIKRNGALMEEGDTKWTFGQTLALLLLMVPIRDLMETLWERRPKSLGRKLLDVSREGNFGVIKSFLELGADANVKDERGYSALHLAASNGHMDISESLIKHRADVNTKTPLNQTALHLAAEGGHVDLARLLINHGADVNTQDNFSQTAFHLAAKKGHVDLARLLIEHGADVNTKDNSHQTAFHLAAKKGYVDLTRSLIEHGADVNTEDYRNQTALHLAVENGHVDLVRFLIEHGADVNMKGVNCA